MKRFLKVICITIITSLIVFSFSTCKDDKHPSVRTTLRIVPPSSSRSIARSSEQVSSFQIYIKEFVIEEDNNSRGRGLWLVSEDKMDYSGGTTGGNADWFDITKSQSVTVMNDFNEGKYPSISLVITGIIINDIEIDIHNMNNNPIQIQLPTRIWFKNDSSINGASEVVVPWDPINIYDDTEELIVTFSMDIEDIIESSGELDMNNQPIKRINNWWERITIQTEVKRK